MNNYKVTWEFYKDGDMGRQLVGNACQDIQADSYGTAYQVAEFLHSAYALRMEFSNVIYTVSQIWK